MRGMHKLMSSLRALAQRDVDSAGVSVRHPIRLAELCVCGLLTVIVPVLIRIIPASVNDVLAAAGFGRILGLLRGTSVIADVATGVATAKGLLLPLYEAYDSIRELHPLIGVPLLVEHAHTHPPAELPIFLPLVGMNVSSWLPFWVVAMFFCLSMSMRVLDVTPFVAYGISLVLVASVPGQESLATTYPLTALLVSIIWKYRSMSLLPGVLIGILIAFRGISGLLFVPFLLASRLKTIGAGLTTFTLLTLTALVLEPTVLTDYLDRGTAAISFTVDRGDNLALLNLERTLHVPKAAIACAVILIAVCAIFRGASIFWVAYWTALALSPIAWSYGIVLLIPLCVYLFSASQLGRYLTLITLASSVANASVWGVNWQISLVFAAIALQFVGSRSRSLKEV